MFNKSKASQTKCTTASQAMEEIISLVLQGCKSATDLQSNLENLADQPDMLSKSCEEIQQVFRNAKERLDHLIFHPAQESQQHHLESLQAWLRSGYTQQTGIPQMRHPAERSPFGMRRSASDVLAAGLGGTELERSALSRSIGAEFHAGDASDSGIGPSSQRQRRRRDDGERRTITVPAPLMGNTEIPPEDGFTWRKYGQKEILGSRFPRAYFRCTHQKLYQCAAKKQVQRLDDDPHTFQVTYRGEHTCHMSSTAPSVSPVAADFTREMTQIITSLPPPTSSVPQSGWLSMDFLGRGGGGGGSSSSSIVPGGGSGGAGPSTTRSGKEPEFPVADMADAMFNSGSSSTNSMDFLFHSTEDK